MQKQKKKEKLVKILKIRISSFSASFTCRRDAYSINCSHEFLKSVKNILNDSDRKVSKLKISLFFTLYLDYLNQIHAIKICLLWYVPCNLDHFQINDR